MLLIKARDKDRRIRLYSIKKMLEILSIQDLLSVTNEIDNNITTSEIIGPSLKKVVLLGLQDESSKIVKMAELLVLALLTKLQYKPAEVLSSFHVQEHFSILQPILAKHIEIIANAQFNKIQIKETSERKTSQTAEDDNVNYISDQLDYFENKYQESTLMHQNDIHRLELWRKSLEQEKSRISDRVVFNLTQNEWNLTSTFDINEEEKR